MATYFNYKGREGKDQVNWQGITKGISDNITKIQGERQQQRVDIDKNITESLEYAANKPQGQDTLQNGIISDFASQAEATLLQAQKDLKSGRIKLRDFTALTNNSVSGTKKMFALSGKYQENYKTNMERLQADPKTGLTAGSGISAVLGSNLEAMGNMVNTKYFMDPKTGETFIAQMAKDGDSNTRVIDGKAMSLMNISEAEGLITRQIDRYQAGTVSDGLSEALGRDVAVVRGLYPDIKTNEDAFSKLITRKADGTIDYDNLPSAGKAIMLNIQGTMSEDIQVASMLFDTMDGYIMVGQNQDGSFINLNKTRNDKGEMVNEVIDELTDKTVLMKQDDRNQYQPDFSGERGMRQRRAAENGVLSMMEDNLDTIQVADTDLRMNEYQGAMLGLKRKELANAQAEKSDSMKVQVRSMGDLYSGDQVNVKAATEYFRDINSTVSLVERIPGGVEVTYTNAEGATVKRPVVFGIENTDFDASKPEGPKNTRFNMVQNTNFDATKPAGPNNQKLIPEIKTQREFMISAGNLLIGADEAKKREFTEIVNSKNENGEFVFNENLSSEKASSAADITEAPKQQTFDIATNKYLDNILESDALDYFEAGNFQDEELAEGINKQFKDIGVIAEATGGLSNEVLVRLPGINETIIIDTNNFTISGSREEKQKLKNFLKLGIGKLKLQEKLNFEVDPSTSKGNTPGASGDNILKEDG